MLAHATQEADTAFCTGARSTELRLMMESESEVVSAVSCPPLANAIGALLGVLSWG